jgi:hypothetical protein
VIPDSRIVGFEFFACDFSLPDKGLSVKFFRPGWKKLLDTGGRKAINIGVSG